MCHSIFGSVLDSFFDPFHMCLLRVPLCGDEIAVVERPSEAMTEAESSMDRGESTPALASLVLHLPQHQILKAIAIL